MLNVGLQWSKCQPFCNYYIAVLQWSYNFFNFCCILLQLKIIDISETQVCCSKVWTYLKFKTGTTLTLYSIKSLCWCGWVTILRWTVMISKKVSVSSHLHLDVYVWIQVELTRFRRNVYRCRFNTSIPPALGIYDTIMLTHKYNH